MGSGRRRRGARLRVAVDRHRVRDRRQRGEGLDRLRARAGDVEGDDVQPRVRYGVVGVENRLPQGAGAGIVGDRPEPAAGTVDSSSADQVSLNLL